jgi:hypothetical protein
MCLKCPFKIALRSFQSIYNDLFGTRSPEKDKNKKKTLDKIIDVEPKSIKETIIDMEENIITENSDSDSTSSYDMVELE